MTEYGRDSGSHPWHPGDPLYGDQGYGGQQQHPQSQQQSSYGQQQYDWDPSQTAGGQYGHQQPGDPQQYGRSAGGYAGGGPDYYAQQDASYPPHPQPQQPGQQQGYEQQGQQGYEQQGAPEPEPALRWNSEPDEEKISLFDDEPAAPVKPAGGSGDADDEPREESRRDRRGKKPKKNKRRSGTACLLVAVVLVGVVGGGGYLAYDYWQSHFGAAPDYEGEGTGQVQVEIPKGAGLGQMGEVLQKAGVVKSVGAFTEAAGKNPKGGAIQPGTYSLHKEMSGKAAVEMMTNAANFLVIAEGRRAVQIYAAIDQKLGLQAGTTKGVAKSEAKNLGLPDWANSDPKIEDPLEGFLFPSQYSAGKGTKPEAVLKQMVARAKENYAKQDLEGKARELGLKSPLQLITVASLVNAEGKTHDDFRKMSRVIYNRLKPSNTQTNGKLEFDSTYNYATNQSKLNMSQSAMRALDHPYNTYFAKNKGLPPGPIGNPGEEALKAAMDPEAGDWYYFVSLDGKTTTFTTTYAEHQKLADEFARKQKQG
ncbi:endolytic transglycosylase MltG [Streptomyces sp. HU2014]|uniref:endolytic transglycosylase MltG n=1 Tax=Streptomyces sp. HU2014 TaxID=2939414 RepID=UPI00200C0CF9|nr:endolytic transglycosylase MltG [Streptomyces sp. HU2014]UQI44560.1 endolytic transglycosylase MltG [Streptomyces sp. HU2014]